MSSAPVDQIVRFSVFEFEVRAGVLRKRGVRLPVQGLPLQVLALLLERSGDVVTREEIRSRLWPADTFVDFDHSLHNAIARLREALGDSATTPRFVETLPRRGYRFIGPVETSEKSTLVDESPSASIATQAIEAPVAVAQPGEAEVKVPATSTSRWPLIALMLGAAALVSLFVISRPSAAPQPALQQVTFRRGVVWNARFSPDGNSLIYGAAWDGKPVEIFEGRLDSAEGRPLGLQEADVLAISRSGEMAVLLNRKRGPSGFGFNGTLARLPLTGGTPRPVMDAVESADWGPDDKLAVIYHAAGKARLEYPIGTLRYECATWLSDVRISPAGDSVAFVEHNEPIGDSGMVRIVDSNNSRVLTRAYGSVEGLAWAPSGKEIWYTAADSGGSARSLRAVDLNGKERALYRVPGTLKIQDIAKDGRVLLVHELIRAGILGHVAEGEDERELGWLDWSIHRSLSKDGKKLLFDESGDAPRGDSWLYLRDTNAGAPEKLGSGSYGDLSPDGNWVAAVPADFGGQVHLLPTGPGQAYSMHFDGLKAYRVGWFPDGKHLALEASAKGAGTQIFVVDVEKRSLHPISPEGVTSPIRGVVSPDGKFVAGRGADGTSYLFDVAGGAAQAVSGLQRGESIVGWTTSGQSVYVGSTGETASEVFVVDLGSGRRRLFRWLAPADKAGLTYLSIPTITPDGRYYVYSYNRQISELFVAQGMR